MRKLLLCGWIAALAIMCGGCSSASAQCPGGRCASVGVWSPWGGVWYYQSPCSGGCEAARAIKAPGSAVASAAAKKGGEAPAGDKGSRPSAVAEEPDEPIPADEAPQLVEFKPFCVRVAELVNAQRKALGLPALELDENLCSGCDRHSAWMASGGGLTANAGMHLRFPPER